MTSSKLHVHKLVVGPLASNCYIVWDEVEKEGVIIDPGEDAATILQTVKELGIHIQYILATHGHFDHIGAVMPLKRELNVPFFAHKEDNFFIKDATGAAHRWGFDIEQPPKPDRFIEHGDVIKVGKNDLTVVHTPGHSPGGVCFVTNNIVFSGDTLFQGSIGRTDFRLGSFDELANSIRTRLYALPDTTIVFPGHGPPTTIKEEKKCNIFVREKT